MKTRKIKIKEVKELLDQGKIVKVKTTNNEFTEIESYLDKGYLPTYEVSLDNGKKIECTNDHRFFSKDGWIECRYLEKGVTNLLCEEGYSAVRDIKYVGEKPIVDIKVAHKEHSYFGNGILNHNTGKSYMAMQLIANAQKMGLVPVYADPEDALDSTFMERSGVDLENVIYLQPANLETFLESMEELMKNHKHKFLFILDSLAACPTKTDVAGTYDPQGSVGHKARVLSLAFQKLRSQLAQTQSTLVILNQLKTNISGLADVQGGPKYAKMTQKYTTPGGKAPEYWASLRIWLTSSTSKNKNVFDDKGYRIGSYVKATLIKSRFGTQDRFAEFKILWGDTVGVMDEESLLEAIKSSPRYTGGSWSKLLDREGKEYKFQSEKGFVKLMKEDVAFKDAVMDILEEEVILKFDKRQGKAEEYYNDGVGDDLET